LGPITVAGKKEDIYFHSEKPTNINISGVFYHASVAQ
jgi:hypothetical protein